MKNLYFTALEHDEPNTNKQGQMEKIRSHTKNIQHEYVGFFETAFRHHIHIANCITRPEAL